MAESGSADAQCMARAITLARRGLYSTDPNPRVGCVIRHRGCIVGEGWHRYAGEPHAETHALRMAGAAAAGADVFVTLEPCAHQGRTSPCVERLIDAGVARVYAAMTDPNPQVCGKGLQRLRDAGIAVHVGLLADDAQALNPGFSRRMNDGRPWVRVKLAASLDGRIAMASGESRWISGAPARRDGQFWRARSSVVMSGAATVRADNPALNVRLSAADLGVARVRQPRRVVLDTQGRCDAGAQVFTLPGPSTWVQADTAATVTALHGQAPADGVDSVHLPTRLGAIDLQSLLRLLAARYAANEVLVEAGSKLAGALLTQGLVDELIVYLAPHVMGDRARGLLTLPGLDTLAQRIALQWVDVRQVGDDLRVILRPRIC